MPFIPWRFCSAGGAPLSFCRKPHHGDPGLDENAPGLANRPELAKRPALGVGVSPLEHVLARLGCFRSGIVWFVISARVRSGLAYSGGGILRDVWLIAFNWLGAEARWSELAQNVEP